MDYPLSETDLRRLLPGVNIVVYKNLANTPSIYNLVANKYFASILLYPAKSDFNGHWVCIFLNSDGNIEFFDPYGYNIDSEWEFTDVQHPRYLSQLLVKAAKSGVVIEYNQHRIQKRDKNIATCGKHVVNRIVNRLMSTDEYFKTYRGRMGQTADELVHSIIMGMKGAPPLGRPPIGKAGSYILFNL